MEPPSEAPGAMAAAEAPCDPSPSSAAPSPAPISSSASTKRRWSPCTWRYAIEDAQAELPSRPRPAAPFSSSATPPSSRAASSPLQPPIKAKLPYHNPLYGKPAEEPQKISSHSPRPHTMLQSHARFSSSQPLLVSKSGAVEVYRKNHRHLHSSKPRACAEDELEEPDGEAAEQDDQDDDDDDGDDNEGFPVFDEEYFKMRRREMSPSERYFCAICSEKAAEPDSTAPDPCDDS